MTLQPIKDVSEYKRLKQTLRDRFESEKTGDQSLLEEQTKKYKPLLSSQQEISKTMQDVANQIVESQNEGQAALQPLLPLLQNIQRAQIAAPGQPGQQALAMAMSSITVRHSSNVPDGACIRSRFHITHSRPGFVSQRYH